MKASVAPSQIADAPWARAWSRAVSSRVCAAPSPMSFRAIVPTASPSSFAIQNWPTPAWY
nr:hypothetical protein [uncultured Caulobacter sp.]